MRLLARSASIILSALTFGVVTVKITSNPSDVLNQTYTHIVVGGGTAGLTVASRLAEVAANKILVIEAGPDARFDPVIVDPAQEIPGVIKYSWFYLTTPQEINGQTLTIPQGKVLGGSSAINGMQWTRGTLDQYDAFERLGMPGWNSASMFSYMKKAERFHPPTPAQTALGDTWEPSVHGLNGPIDAGYFNPQRGSFIYNSYVSSVTNLSGASSNSDDNARTIVQKVKDLCAGAPRGAARFFYSIIPGRGGTNPVLNRRASSAEGYIYPFVSSNTSSPSPAPVTSGKKDNLIILVGHQVSRILWKDRTVPSTSSAAQATGVEFISTPAAKVDMPWPPPQRVHEDQNPLVERDVPLFQVNLVQTKGEVIVASGALGSPAVLERSGVGDPKILSKFNIPVTVSLPSVGTNLQDQPLTTSIYNLKPSPPPGVPMDQYNDTTNQITQGSVAYLDIFQVLGKRDGKAMATDLLNTAKDRAKEIVSAGGFTSVEGLKKIFVEQAESILNRNAPVVEMSFDVNGSGPGVSTHLVWNLLPQVRGTVHIQSADPTVLPAVNPKYLTTPFELLLHSNATKLSRTIFNTAPLSSIVLSEVQPGSSVQTNSDAAWQAFVKENVTPVLHPVGSCAMLPKADGGVVDSKLKVYGTANVRVVDSSIMPIQISAHLSATVYGIAEKAADIIK